VEATSGTAIPAGYRFFVQYESASRAPFMAYEGKLSEFTLAPLVTGYYTVAAYTYSDWGLQGGVGMSRTIEFQGIPEYDWQRWRLFPALEENYLTAANSSIFSGVYGPMEVWHRESDGLSVLAYVDNAGGINVNRLDGTYVVSGTGFRTTAASNTTGVKKVAMCAASGGNVAVFWGGDTFLEGAIVVPSSMSYVVSATVISSAFRSFCPAARSGDTMGMWYTEDGGYSYNIFYAPVSCNMVVATPGTMILNMNGPWGYLDYVHSELSVSLGNSYGLLTGVSIGAMTRPMGGFGNPNATAVANYEAWLFNPASPTGMMNTISKKMIESKGPWGGVGTYIYLQSGVVPGDRFLYSFGKIARDQGIENGFFYGTLDLRHPDVLPDQLMSKENVSSTAATSYMAWVGRPSYDPTNGKAWYYAICSGKTVYRFGYVVTEVNTFIPEMTRYL